jgi:N-acetyl-gamma-glutamyl-phosphate reductase
MVRVGIAGATGYTGVELLRILRGHPEAVVVYAGTESYVDQELSQVFPHLQGVVALQGARHDAAAMAEACDLVFLAVPHGVAMEMAPPLLAAGKQVIDLGADFRLKDGATFEKWYKHHPAPGPLLEQAVYGLPEAGYRPLVREASLVANPGCYPTSCALAAMPALREGLVETKGIIFDSKSGVSGAGRKPSLAHHFTEVAENFSAYGVAGAHRHTPEIEQTLSTLAGEPITVQFTPHLLPIARGILTTAYFQLRQNVSTEAVWELYTKAYEGEPFVRVRPLGDLPQTKQVFGSNFCDISVQVDRRTGRLIVISVIDNLVKGASGQAVQNMNLMCGLPETTGLAGLLPVYP